MRYGLWCICIILMVACASVPRREPVIRIAGSDTMLPLNKVLAAAYDGGREKAVVKCQGGGTTRGMEALINGTVDICAASRPITAEEVKALAERYYSIGMAHLVCKDALEIWLHPRNSVQSLQTAQVQAIFSGKINNWRQVGGTDRPIHVYIRKQGSGTHRYFAEHLLQDLAYAAQAIEVASNAEMARSIARDPAAIGYGGHAFRGQLNACRLDGIAPDPEPVGDSAYPLSRYLYFYTVDATYGAVNEFIHWAVSPASQMLIENSGYIPIWRRAE